MILMRCPESETRHRVVVRAAVRAMLGTALAAAIAMTTSTSRAAGQEQGFRPSNLGDLVKAVGVSRLGLEDAVDLSRVVAQHALFIGDEVGIAARLRDDPDGPIFVAWRTPGEPWRFAFAGEADFPPIPPDAGAAAIGAIGAGARSGSRLGYLKTITPAGSHLAIETHPTPDRPSTVVLRRDLTPLAQIDGRVVLGLPSGALIVERAQTAGGVTAETLLRADVATRRLDRLYPAVVPAAPDAPAMSGEPMAARSIRIPSFDPATDTLTFVVTGDAEGATRIVTCRPMSSASPVCA